MGEELPAEGAVFFAGDVGRDLFGSAIGEIDNLLIGQADGDGERLFGIFGQG